MITLEDGTELWFCHQNEFGVSEGDVVAAGDVIGYVGSTGNVTGPTCTSRSAPAPATRSTRTPRCVTVAA